MNAYSFGEIELCNPGQDFEDVITMVATNDDTHTFMPIAITLEGKARLMRDFLEEPRDNFIIRNEKGSIVGYITLAKRKSASKELAEELDYKHPHYKKMLLSRPDLPEKSTGFIIRVSLIIAKGERRKGLGKKLMAYAMKHAAKDPTVEAIEFDMAIHDALATKLRSLGYQELLRNDELRLISFRKEVSPMRGTKV